MRAFRCGVCGAELYFENSVCVRCTTPTGYHRDSTQMVPLLDHVTPGARRHVDSSGFVWQACANLDVCGCNWVSPAWVSGLPSLCFSCALTRTRPADDDTLGMAAFAVAEFAKRRLIFSLDQLRLPITPRDDVTAPTGLAFDLLSSAQATVFTGHHNGVITVDLAESDDAHREELRISMAEPYRTVLGHFRHEIGHYYWALLVGGTRRVESFRALFGDERTSYDDAVSQHYARGTPPGWESTHISRYATMHPWEDFAEVFAHFLHITDTLQTAEAYGLGGGHPAPAETFDQVVRRLWLPLTRGLNQINRSMGKDDLYPFLLAPAVISKLAWIADLVGWRP